MLIGFSREVAWGMTALGADQADLFRLRTDRGHPDQYFFDGEWRAMEVRRERMLHTAGNSCLLFSASDTRCSTRPECATIRSCAAWCSRTRLDAAIEPAYHST